MCVLAGQLLFNCQWTVSRQSVVRHSALHNYLLIAGFVLSENILATEKLYPSYFLLGTMLFAGYISERYCTLYDCKILWLSLGLRTSMCVCIKNDKRFSLLSWKIAVTLRSDWFVNCDKHVRERTELNLDDSWVGRWGKVNTFSSKGHRDSSWKKNNLIVSRWTL